ncbi:MAG: hypothetical protein LBJ67_04135 [Planctomycetaceae bacterium]|nr:hypothetical protein [Planctomycetaceae bacterium]
MGKKERNQNPMSSSTSVNTPKWTRQYAGHESEKHIVFATFCTLYRIYILPSLLIFAIIRFCDMLNIWA